MKTCKFGDCERKFYCKGYCRSHYEKLKRDGEVSEIAPRVSRELSMADRIEEKSHREGECVLWDGGVNSEGYPRIKFQGEYYLTSRWIFENSNGPVESSQVRHTCGKKLCIAEEHLITV